MSLGIRPHLQRIAARSRQTWRIMDRAQVFIGAGNLAYTTILSIIPVLAVGFALFRLFGGLDKAYSVLEPLILQNLAQASGQEAIHQIREFIENARDYAGAVGVGGVIGLLFTGYGLFSSIENAVNRIWEASPQRPFLRTLCYYWTLLSLGPIALGVILGLISRIMPAAMMVFLSSTLLLFLLYKYVPSRKVATLPAIVSALLASALWNVAGIAYAAYTQRAISYRSIYGSLGAIPILLLWIYITWLIVLSGAALCFALHHAPEKSP